MTPRSPAPPPLVLGGQGRSGAELLVGVRVLALCAVGILAVALLRALGAL